MFLCFFLVTSSVFVYSNKQVTHDSKTFYTVWLVAAIIYLLFLRG